MAGDYGNIVIQGFKTGLDMRRNWEETAQLIHDREEKAQAEALLKQAAEKYKERESRVLVKKSKAEELRRLRQAGKPISEQDIAAAISDVEAESIGALQYQADIATELMGSGNKLAMEYGQNILKSNFERLEAYAGQRAQQKQIDAQLSIARDQEAGATTRTGMELASRESEGKKNRQNNLQTVGMQTSIQQQQVDIQKRESLEGSETEKKRMSLEEQRLKVQGVTSIVEALGRGADPKLLQSMMGQLGMTGPEDFESTLGNISEETAEAIRAIDSEIKLEEGDIEKGQGDDEMLKMLRRKREKLREQDRAARKAQLHLEAQEEKGFNWREALFSAAKLTPPGAMVEPMIQAGQATGILPEQEVKY